MDTFIDVFRFIEKLTADPPLLFFLVSMAVVALALIVAMMALNQKKHRSNR